MSQSSTIIKENSKFKTAAIGCFLRFPLTSHNFAYANLLARMQMNASLYFPSIRLQQEALSNLYDVQLEILPQVFGKEIILSYLADFIEPTEILDPDYNYAKIIEDLTLIIQHPSFDQDLLDFSRQQLLNDYQEIIEEPANLAMDHFFKLWYKDNPDFAETFMGPIDEIKQATSINLQRFSQQLINCSTTIIGLGKYPRKLQRIIESNFTSPGLTQDFHVSQIVIPAPQLKETKTEEKGNLQAQLLLGYGINHELSYQEQIAGEVLTQYLAGSQSSLLFTKIREELGAAYAIDAIDFANNSLFLISLGLDPAKAKRAVQIICTEMNKIAEGKIDVQLLKKVKKELVNQRLINNDQESWQLKQLLRKQLFVNYDNFDGLQGLKAVTPNQLISFAQNLFLNESYILK